MNDALHRREFCEVDSRAALRGTAPKRRRRARDVFHLMKMNDTIARDRDVLPLFVQNDACARDDDADAEKEENVRHHVHPKQPNRRDGAGNVARERRRRRRRSDAHGEPRARQRPSQTVFERVAQTLSRRHFFLTVRPVVVNDEDIVGADADGEKQSREVKRTEPTPSIYTEIRRVREDGGAGDAQRSSDADDDRARLDGDECDRHAHRRDGEITISAQFVVDDARVRPSVAPRHAHALEFRRHVVVKTLDDVMRDVLHPGHRL